MSKTTTINKRSVRFKSLSINNKLIDKMDIEFELAKSIYKDILKLECEDLELEINNNILYIHNGILYYGTLNFAIIKNVELYDVCILSGIMFPEVYKKYKKNKNINCLEYAY